MKAALLSPPSPHPEWGSNPERGWSCCRPPVLGGGLPSEHPADGRKTRRSRSRRRNKWKDLKGGLSGLSPHALDQNGDDQVLHCGGQHIHGTKRISTIQIRDNFVERTLLSGWLLLLLLDDLLVVVCLLRTRKRHLSGCIGMDVGALLFPALRANCCISNP